jgi:WD40 repeat protein
MLRKTSGLVVLFLCGVFLYAAGSSENGGGGERGLVESEAFFPVVDALSSASILRVNAHTMAYIGERTGSSYKLNRVDLDNPAKKVSRDIGGNVAVISAGGGKIGIIQAVEHGYEAFAGSYTKIYDAHNLSLIKTIPLAPPAAGGRIVEPLHHRDPSLAVSDKYAVAATEDDGFFSSGGAQQYVSVYDIAGDKGASHTPAFAGNAGGARGGANSALGVGTIMGVAVNGDFLLVGGSTGTAVFKIDSSGGSLALSRTAASDGAGNHWFKDNGSYVLESKSNTGTVKVWKWNGSAAPTAVGTVDVNGNNSGSIQALCFDPDDPAKAYFYCKLAAGTGNGGNVYSVNLGDPSLPKTLLFNFSHLVIQISGRGGSAYYDCPLTGLWTIEKQKSGQHDYFVFSGSYSYTPAGGSAATVGGVITVIDPPIGSTIGGAYTDSANAVLDERIIAEQFTSPWNTAIRTLKTFKNSSGEVYFAAKNYTANGAASNYKLVLKKLN